VRRNRSGRGDADATDGSGDAPAVEYVLPVVAAAPPARNGGPMIEQVIDEWYRHLRGELPGGLESLLDDDVVFYSPIVYTPQRGKDLTAMYLRAAAQALPGEAPVGAHAGDAGAGDDAPLGGSTAFRYTKKVLAGDTAVLEFETSIEGTYVNGVDIIRCNEAGRIVEFRVMIRPLRAVDAVHRQMRSTLERMQSHT
jgi:hypothetical protein